ncbi:hypothetical protein RvY_07734 [Ramazzottius varieornatus]|uniref:NudC domain-containing protein 1 n=1 Tax=Ramazzottius varieornatus TaxID=947166 RepID=A0A1D1V3A3_RAMVA|nr:hypothetical protein RvY_07734 [Ramazzottius varieornatus]
MAVSVERLPIDRSLLNPMFEGYKLSFDEIGTDDAKTLSGVLGVKLPDDLFSYQHTAAFSSHNALTLDQWYPDNVYYVNRDLEFIGCRSRDQEINRSHNARKVAQIPRPKETHDRPRSNICLNFISPQLAVISDGFGKLLLAATSNRQNVVEEDNQWRLDQVNGYACPDTCVIVHASTWKRGDESVIEVIVVRVASDEKAEKSDTKDTERFRTTLEWLTIGSIKDGNSSWSVERTRTLEGKRAPYYAAITNNGQAISICATQAFRFMSDSVVPVVASDGVASELPDYTWTQTAENVIVHLSSPFEVQKSDVSFELSGSSITMGVTNGRMFFQGELGGEVDVGQSSWTVTNNMVEIVLNKNTTESWKEVIKGDERGKEISGDEDFAQRVTSEDLVGSGDLDTFNTDQLEECDTSSEEVALWIRVDGNSHLITHKVDVSGNENVFGPVVLDADQPACLCLRHNVDGLLFQPVEPKNSEEHIIVQHVHTFDALGYVMASKRDKKFASCPPNASFAALCDNERNIFIYRSDVSVDSTLKNRKSGKIIKKVAKQHIVSLKEPGPILGFAVNDSHVFVLKSDILFTIKLK